MPALDLLKDRVSTSFVALDLQIDALDIIQGGGGIHCITQQEPAAP